MARYYQYSIEVRCTDSGPLAYIQGLDADNIWQDIAGGYAPDGTADPESVGATVSASGVSLPTGTMQVGKSSEAQYWVWKLDGTGNIPITIDTSTRGVLTVSTEIDWVSGHDDGLIGVWVGDAAPTAAAGGVSNFIIQTTSPNYHAYYSRNDGAKLIYISSDPDLSLFDMILNYCDSVIEESIISVYDASETFIDHATTSTNFAFTTPAIAILAGHNNIAAGTVVVNPALRIYWTDGTLGITLSDSEPANYGSSEAYNGFLIQDKRICTANINASLSSYTQAGGRAGIPTPNRTTNLVCQASGDQAISYDVYIDKAGFPGDGTFLWRPESEADFGYLGAERLTVSKELFHVSQDTGSENIKSISSITTKSGRVVAVWAELLGGVGTTAIYGSYFDGQKFTTRQTIMYAAAGSATYRGYELDNSGNPPCVQLLYYEELNRIICVARRVLSDNGAGVAYGSFVTWYSDDEGETWEVQTDDVFGWDPKNSGSIFMGTSSDNKVFALVRVGESIVLVNRTSSSYVTTFASADYGLTFKYLGADTSTDVGEIDHLTAAGNMLIYLNVTDENLYMKIFTQTVKFGAITPEELSGGPGRYMALFQDYSGKYHAFVGKDGDAADLDSTTDKWGKNVYLFANIQAGTGETINTKPKRGVFSTHRDDAAIIQMAATKYKGGAFLFFRTDDGDYGDHICALRVGGFSNLCLPDWIDADYYEWMNYGLSSSNKEEVAAYPIDDPASGAWAKLGTDNVTFELDSYGRVYFDFAATASPSCVFYETLDYSEYGYILDFEAKPSTTGTSAMQVGFDIDLDTGSDLYTLQIRFWDDSGTASYKIVDAVSGSTIYDGVFGDSDSLKFRVAMKDDVFKIFVSADTGAAFDGIERWTLIADDTLTAGTSSSAGFTIAWGCRFAGNDWGVYYVLATAMVEKIVYDLSTADDIDGDVTSYRQGYFTGTSKILIEDSFFLAFKDGPPRVGDSWLVEPAYDYGIKNIDIYEQPSPRVSWRSSADNQEEIIVWTLANGKQAEMPTPIFAVQFSKCNFKTCYIEGKTSLAGSWEEILEINFAAGFEGLAYESAGVLTYGPGLIPASGTESADKPIFHYEVAGGHVILTPSGGDPAYFKIDYNTEGLWRDITTKKPVLYIEDWTSTDPGELDICWPNTLMLTHDFVSKYAYIRLRIPAQETAEGYYEIGQMVLGSVYVFGKKYSKGRVYEMEPNVELQQTASGFRQAQELGPGRRGVEFSWVDGAGDEMPLLSTTAAPRYVEGTDGGEPLTFRHSTPQLLEGLYRQIRGPLTPFVYIPRIPYDVTPYQTHAYRDFIYARIVTTLTQEGVLGNESYSEVVNVRAIKAEEET